MKFHRKFGKRLLAFAFGILFALGMAALISWYGHLSFWICAPLAVVSILVNGALASWEDGDSEPSSTSEQASAMGRRPRG